MQPLEVGRAAVRNPQGVILVRDDKGAPPSDRCLVVFADDWGRHPSSCQHLVRELLDTCDVTWINTVGTRGLSFDFELMRRGVQKLKQWGSRPAGQAPRDRGPAPVVQDGKSTRLNSSHSQISYAVFCSHRKKSK